MLRLDKLSCIFAGVLLIAVTACSSPVRDGSPISRTQEAGYELPPNIRYSVNWVETDALDLMSAEGTFVRAYYEAKMVAIFAPGGLTVTFPGFVDADRTTMRDQYHGGLSVDQSGAHTWSVVELSDLGDGAMRAEVCGRVTARQDSPGRTDIELLYFRKAGESPSSDQRGSRPAPAADPFGDWYAFDSVNVFTYKTRPEVARPDIDHCDSLPSVGGPTSWPGWPEAGV